MAYTPLLLRIERLGEAGKYRATLRHPNEGASEPVEFPWKAADVFWEDRTYAKALKDINEFVSSTEKNPYLERLGNAMYELVFGGNLQDRFRGWCKNTNDVVALRIYCADAAVAALPWELVRDPSGFLGQRMSILRYDERWGDRRTEFRRPLTALVVTAAPDLAGYRFDDAAYAEQVSAHLQAAGADVKVERNVTRATLLDLLTQHRPQIFHFIGHGQMEAVGGSIVLTDPDYKKTGMEGGTLGDQLRRAGVQFAFLCSCETGKDSHAFRGVASALAEKGVPAVVAMQFNLPQTDAKIFVDRFYNALCKGSNVENALSQTRASFDQKRLVWFIPALHSQVDGEIAPQPFAAPKTPVSIEKNPFLDIGAHANPERFAGRHVIVNDLLDALLQRRNVLVAGERRAGKTALLRVMTDPGKCRSFGFDPKLHVHILLDVSGAGPLSPDSLEAWLWQNAIRGLERAIEDSHPEKPDPIRQAAKAVRASGGERGTVWTALQTAVRKFSVAFFLDEFDHLVDGGLGRDFFDWLVLLNEQLGVQFIAAPRARPEYYVEMGRGLAHHFFDSCRKFELGPFEPSEVNEYVELHVQDALRDHYHRFGAALCYLSGCSPFYLQIACAELFQVRATDSATIKDWVSRIWEQASKSLPDHWNGSTVEEQMVLAVLALRAQGPGRGARMSKQALADYCPRVSAFDDLRDRGLAIEENGRVALSNPCLGAWILHHLAAPPRAEAASDRGDFREWFQARYTQDMAEALPARSETLFNRLNPDLWEWLTKWCRRLRYQDSALSLLSLAPVTFDPVEYLAGRCPAVERKR